MKLFIAAAATTVLVGCTNKPIPDDYAGLSTYRIVQKVRCEAQDAMRAIVFGLLNSETHNEALIKSLRAPTTEWELAAAYRQALENELENLKPTEVKDLIKRYQKAEIAYSFTFGITENNDLDGSSTFLDVITGGTFSLGFTASNKQERKNQRALTILDDLEELVTTELKILTNARDATRLEGCDDIDTGRDGVVYPIKGDLGLQEFFLTFFQLDRWANLTAEGKNVDESGILTDTMTFTTTLDAKLSPSITLDTGVANIRLGDAELGLRAARKDEHQLIIAIAMPTKEAQEEAEKAKEELRKAEGARKVPSKPKLSEQRVQELNRKIDAVEAEAQRNNAVNAIQQQRDRLFQQNVLILTR